jgi:pimeloyl-ACP methyl ester carboxylesterase
MKKFYSNFKLSGLAVVTLILFGVGVVSFFSALQAGNRDWKPTPTLGGKQFWADELFFHDWHIQRNVLTGHYRLLDGEDRRYGWGSFEHCKGQLEEIRQERKLPPMRGTAVILLHGLIRSHASMQTLSDSIREKTGWTFINVEYPSTREPIAAHAAGLATILDRLEGIDQIYIVAHSMGNIVVRHYLRDCFDSPSRKIDPRINRMVMLGPPNHGSLMAKIGEQISAVALANGQPLIELGEGWAKTRKKLATPNFEFGIIAGGLDDDKGFNPLLSGDDDGTVSIKSARLAGARDFLVVPVAHSFLMNDPRVIDSTIRFLQKGYFQTETGRRPIPRTQKEATE